MRRGQQHTAASKSKIGEALAGRPKTAEHRRNIRISRTRSAVRSWTDGPVDTLDKLRIQAAAIAGSAFWWYLSGPMSGIPKHNFPEFAAVARHLRSQGWPIVSPHELDRAKVKRASLRSRDGLEIEGDDYDDLLKRDIVVCSMASGAVLLPNWWLSRGARMETFVIATLRRPLLEYPTMERIERDAALRQHGIYTGAPADEPGQLTRVVG